MWRLVMERPHSGAPSATQAIAALPEELQEEARRVDKTPFPIKRAVFTETPPIKDFQAKLTVSYQDD